MTRDAEELMMLRDQGTPLTPQEEQKIIDFLADRRGERVPDGADVNDFVVEMLTRAIPEAPAQELADAAEKFQRILENERRRAREEMLRLVWQEDPALAQKLEWRLR